MFRSNVTTLAAAFMFSWAGPSSALNLEDAIFYVLETNPEIKAAEANKQAIEFELDQARAFNMPRFELEAWTGASINDGSTTSDLTAADDAITGYQVRGRMTQKIFDGYETRSEIERQAFRVDAAALRVLERSEFLSLEAIRLYADVLRSQELVALGQRNVDYHRAVYDRLEGGFEGGVVPVGDIQQAEERLYLAEDTLLSFELDLQDIEDNFLAIVGVEPSSLAAMPGVASAIPGSLDQALGIARRRNPSIRFSQADVGTSEAMARVAAANKYPTIDLEADVLGGEDVNGFEGAVRDAKIGLVMRYEFQGGRKKAERQEQVRRISETRADLLRRTRVVEKEVRHSWASMRSAERRRAVVEKQAALARELRETYQNEYQVGARSLLDILNTQNSLFQAEANLVNARSFERYVKYRLLAATGTLLPTLGIQPPEDANPYAGERSGAPAVGTTNANTHFDASSYRDWRKSVDN
ncbi:TolC family outer membrane protein [Qingshengfaniella alkalisoli]|uniref:TolC family outer membrane protein n=1 Tax=Qingshengfaniella alkalisoli TaxID=2599296 RepID=A0A5B8J098_9RHOB|nr:TolC family outer membrane protein [Qingshengfaniella alkalisoli]QDY71732.1 TolC family outer membrane protein [Qingshengfaniella alkalisoli]